MLGSYAKTWMLVATLVVVVVELFFVYRWYDRYHAVDSSVGVTVAEEMNDGGMKNASGESTVTEASEDVASGSAEDGKDTNLEASSEEDSFVHRATDGNSRGDYTYLDHPAINGDPNAVVLVVPAPDRGNAGASAYAHNIGVWYESGAKKWAIFNQDRAPVSAGTTFRVVVPPASEGFVGRLKSGFSGANGTYLNHPLINGEPNAVVMVTQNWNPGGGVGIYNDHTIDVDYDEERAKWMVYNSDLAPMKEGAAFNVGVS